jgi:curved DNA-binding protein CbpA
VPQRPFVDYYEVLQLSPRANTETIERVYRFLAKRYHPDNLATGDPDKFNTVHEAYQTLADPERRASYDVRYDEVQAVQWKVFDQQTAADGREEDRRVMHAVLSLLYIERRRNPERGGLGPIILERMLGVPEAHLEFPLWYMKQRGWIEIMPSGQLGITVAGIDKVSERELAVPENRLLPESSLVHRDEPAGGSGNRRSPVPAIAAG